MVVLKISAPKIVPHPCTKDPKKDPTLENCPFRAYKGSSDIGPGACEVQGL